MYMVLHGYIQRWWGWIVLAGLVGLLFWMYYPTLGSYALRDWDESIYAQVAKQSTDLFGFTWLGSGPAVPQSVWFEKPPLLIWLVQSAYSLWGVSEFSARAVMPLFGSGILLVTFLWAKHLRGTVAGLLACALFGVCYQFLLAVGTLNYDIPMAFFILLALYAYMRLPGNARFWYVFWVSVALGILTKNVIGLFPVCIVLIDMTLSKKWQLIKLKTFLPAACLCLAMVLPWHVVESLRYGADFWRVYIGYHVLSRFASGIENNGQPWWWYTIIFTQLPFAFFAFFGFCSGVYGMLKRHTRHVYLLLMISLVFIFMVLSAAQTKGANYIVLVYPYIHILAAVAICGLLYKIKFAWLRTLAVVVLFGACVYSGMQFNSYRVVRMQGAVYEDVKEIGQWLASTYPDRQPQYISFRSADFIIAGRPSLVYYSNRPVSEAASMPEAGEVSPPVYRTRTHQVYIRNGTVYVVAVRYVP